MNWRPFVRNSDIIKTIIIFYVNDGNTIITDGFPSYNYLNEAGSAYIHNSQNHGGGNSVLSLIYLLLTINSVEKKYILFKPEKIVLDFLKETEFKLNLKFLSNKAFWGNAIQEFNGSFKFLRDIEDIKLGVNVFLTASLADMHS